MRAALFTAAAAAIVASGLVAPSASARPATSEPCVTQREWKQVKVGMKKARVHKILDTRGAAAGGGGGGYTREYEPCAWNGGTDVRLFVTYDIRDNRVAEKRLR